MINFSDIQKASPVVVERMKKEYPKEYKIFHELIDSGKKCDKKTESMLAKIITEIISKIMMEELNR